MVIYKKDSKKKRLTDAYLPAWVMNQSGKEQIRNNAIGHIAKKLNLFNILKITEKITPWICESDIAELLDVTEGTPIFHISWKFIDQDDRPLWYAESRTTINVIMREAEFDINNIDVG